MNKNLIGLTGFARTGKDVVGDVLVGLGHQRKCFGDVIKTQLNPFTTKHLGISAFTEIDDQKSVIRPLLELWGEVNYNNISREFFHNLPDKAVNTRMMTARQVAQWRAVGGIVVDVRRPGKGPATALEERSAADLEALRLIDLIIENDGTLEDLRRTTEALFGPRNDLEGLVSAWDRPGPVRCRCAVVAEPGQDRRPARL